MAPVSSPPSALAEAASTTGPVVVVGAGGFGREVLDIVEAMNAAGARLDLLGSVDDGTASAALLARRGVAHLGPIDEYIAGLTPDGAPGFVIGIGAGAVRRELDARLTAAGLTPMVLVHPMATVGGDNRIAEGCILAAGARVTTNITLGRHTQLHVNSTIGHDSVLDDFVSVYPGATVSGNVHLADGVTIGTGANVLPGRVGRCRRVRRCRRRGHRRRRPGRHRCRGPGSTRPSYDMTDIPTLQLPRLRMDTTR